MASSLFIVEDDTIYAQFLKANFKNQYDVSTFTTAEECLESLKETTPEVIILDYNLPGMSGIELYEQVKPMFDNTKVIVLSSIDDGAQVLEFIKKGVNDYVVKDDNVITSLKNVIEEKDSFSY